MSDDGRRDRTLRPRFERIALSYGCHRGEHALSADDRPLVIAGPNGAGKSTLVEGVVRTLYGFNRRSEAARLEARRPWTSTGDWSARLTVARSDGGRLRIEREFETDRVRVWDPESGEERFAGDGNPAASNQEARRFKQLLAELLGLRDLLSYRRTVYIRQGALDGTELGEHLLRVAAGGHANVDAARDAIREAYRSVTQRALVPGDRSAINPRDLEDAEAEIGELRARLDAARRAAERRGPLVDERDEVAGRLASLEAEIERLEEAHATLAKGGAAEVERRQLRDWVERLEEARGRLERAGDALARAAADWERVRAAGLLPDDFPERLARIRTRWRDLADLEGRPSVWLAAGAGALLGVGALLAMTGQTALATSAAALGAVIMLFYYAFRRDAQARRAAARAEIDDALHDVPDGARVTPDTAEDRLARFREQVALRQKHAEAEAAAAQAVDGARDALAEAIDALALETPDPADGADAAALSAGLRAAVREANERLARRQVELDEVGDASLELPEHVKPTPESVAEALRGLREERSAAQDRLDAIKSRLREEATPAESVTALERRLARSEEEHAELRQRADALQQAYALLDDAYEEFRARDQERLVRFVSRRLNRLTDGALGPVEAPLALEDASVRMGHRAVAFESPPLSFGELHAVLLAVRLGAADFLAGAGVLPPLIIDEPFAHLDDERAESVWRLLEGIAHDRQVIIATQETRLLKRLGVEPDIPLERRRPERDEGGRQLTLMD